jgi:hypothetical protein
MAGRGVTSGYKKCACIILVVLCLFDRALALRVWRPYPSILFNSSSQTKVENKLSKSFEKKKSWLETALNNLTSGTVPVGPKAIHHTLYWLTAADAIQSVLHNQYMDLLGSLAPRPYDNHMVPSVYSRLFYFARLRPRLLYAVGALLRALQLCTPLGRILDPTIGVGAGINLCAMLGSCRWVKPVILGWTTTKYLWRWLGAQRTQRAFLPITLSIREWEEQKSKKRAKEDLND